MLNPIVARPDRFSPMPAQIPQFAIAHLARTLAQCRRDLPSHGSLTGLPVEQQTELKALARLLIDPAAFTELREDIDLRLRKTLAQHVHGSTFERLHVDDQQEIVREAGLALGVVLQVLAGEVEPLPAWERDILLGRIEDGE